MASRASAILVLALVAASCGPQRGTIGAALGQRPDGRVFVRQVPEGLGAHEAGVREGDEVLLIEGEDVRQMSSDEIHEALSGAEGQPVKLTVVRGAEVLRVTVYRTPPTTLRPSASSE